MSEPLRISFVAAERVPLAKIGGLADVAGALTEALAARGHAVRCWLPGYESLSMPEGARRETAIEHFDVPFGTGSAPAAVERVRLPGSRVEVLLVDHLGPAAYFRRTGIYADPATGEPFADDGERFTFFCRAVCEGMRRLGPPPDVVHLNDYQAAWIAAFLRTHFATDPVLAGVASVYTIHNLAYLGLFPPSLLDLAGIPRDAFRAGSPFEFWNEVNVTKVGLEFADLLTTVSPRYAREIQTSEFGCGLDGVLRRRAADLVGILNGIDVETWNPATDPHLAARYSASDLSGKVACKAALAREAGWPEDSPWPIAGMITRLTEQKGFDLLEATAADLFRQEMRLFVLGDGDRHFRERLQGWMREHPERVHARFGFDDPLAHRIEGGADLFLMPSRYEPCGLNQMMSQRYGTVPVVRGVGGLADTVQDFDPETREGTGFIFAEYRPAALLVGIKRALAVYRQPHVWQQAMHNGMRQDFSWQASARRYEEAYREARARRAMR